MTLRLDAKRPADLDRAAALLRAGSTVAFPTETVYGLGANALDPTAVARIFTAKQRPAWDPLIVHISSRAMLPTVADLSANPELLRRAEALIAAFWPGPLTLLLPRASAIPDAVTAGRPRVGVRMPAHPVARALIAAAGTPIAAPSANRFGHTSPTTAAHVLADLDGRIDAVLDGGPSLVGLESTVLDLAETPMRIYRPGVITPAQIEEVLNPPTSLRTNSPTDFKAGFKGGYKINPKTGLQAHHQTDPQANLQTNLKTGLQTGLQTGSQASLQTGHQTDSQASLQTGLQAGPQANLQTTPPAVQVELFLPNSGDTTAAPESLPSPGVGLRHYAPEARLLLVEGADDLLATAAAHPGRRIGVLLPDRWPSRPGMEIYPWGPWTRPDVLAQRLFAGLRELDARRVTLILCPLPPLEGLGAALRDRLQKAARSADSN